MANKRSLALLCKKKKKVCTNLIEADEVVAFSRFYAGLQEVLQPRLVNDVGTVLDCISDLDVAALRLLVGSYVVSSLDRISITIATKK